ncbi:MAG: hypothetical protein J7K51_05855, partial [Thermotogae bacterium]|nr:hypothetical protein [Thermotogota bacterium]
GRNQCVFEGPFSKNTVFMLCPGHRMASSMLFLGYFLAKLSYTHFTLKSEFFTYDKMGREEKICA